MAEVLAVVKIIGIAAQSSKAAWEIGREIYAFIEGVRQVDETLKDLAAEARNLGNICEAVQAQCESIRPVVKEDSGPVPGIASLVTNLGQALEDCERTLSTLRSEVAKVTKIDSSRKFSKLRRQTKLRWQTSEIQSARSQIGRHTQNLNTLLQVGVL